MAYGYSRPVRRMIKPKTKSTSVSTAMMKRLREHARLHQGGMQGKHMKNMIKAIKKGKSFSEAHKEAIKLDKKK